MNKNELIEKIKEVSERKGNQIEIEDPIVKHEHVLRMILPDTWYHFIFNAASNNNFYYGRDLNYYKIESSYEELCNLVKLYAPDNLLAWKLYYVIVNGVDNNNPRHLGEQFEIYRHFTSTKLSTLYSKVSDIFGISDGSIDPIIDYHCDISELRRDIEDKDMRIVSLESKVEKLESQINNMFSGFINIGHDGINNND